MNEWLLIIILAGDPAPIGVAQPVDRETCLAVPARLEAGETITADLTDDTARRVIAATCIPPCDCDG